MEEKSKKQCVRPRIPIPIRKLIVEKAKKNVPPKDIAEMFEVSRSAVDKILRKHKRGLPLKDLSRRHTPSKITPSLRKKLAFLCDKHIHTQQHPAPPTQQQLDQSLAAARTLYDQARLTMLTLSLYPCNILARVNHSLLLLNPIDISMYLFIYFRHTLFLAFPVPLAPLPCSSRQALVQDSELAALQDEVDTTAAAAAEQFRANIHQLDQQRRTVRACILLIVIFIFCFAIAHIIYYCSLC